MSTGKPILLLRLEGPLQSWGTRSRWSRRDTAREPTKSGIIGMLGCAAGILRPDWRSGLKPDRTLEEWDRALRFGVRVDREGVIETDYHTVEGRMWQANRKLKTASSPSGASYTKAMLEPPRTEETWRDYIHDGSFLVALEGEGHFLKELAGYLVAPKWPLFLGRKACVPSRPIFDRIASEYDDLESALRSEPWSWPSQAEQSPLYRKDPKSLIAWIEDPAGDFERPDAFRLNRLRFYDIRRCRRLQVPTDGLPRRAY